MTVVIAKGIMRMWKVDLGRKINVFWVDKVDRVDKENKFAEQFSAICEPCQPCQLVNLVNLSREFGNLVPDLSPIAQR